MDNLDFTKEEKSIVIVYTAISRIYWLSKVYIHINQSTSSIVDPARVESANKTIDGVMKE